jgi:hypothetical protein
MTAPDNIPEIISAAAQSRLGMLALLVILLAAVGYGLFRKAAESTRLVIFSMLFVGVCGFGVAVLRADSQGSPPAPNESRSNAKKSRPIHGNAAGKSADQNGIALDAGNKAEGTKPADKSARAGPTIEKDSAVGSQRDSAPLDFSDIKVGGKYIITDRFGHKDSIQAPLYKDVPGRLGGLGDKTGQELEPNRSFTVIGIYRTPRKGFGWLRVRADAIGSQPPLSGWLQWGTAETPMVPSDRG